MNAPIDVIHEGGELIVRVRASSEPVDVPVAIEATALAKYGLEEKPVRRLAESGRLQYRTIGRRRVTSLKWLLECLYALPAKVPDAPEDDVVIAARKRAAKVAR